MGTAFIDRKQFDQLMRLPLFFLHEEKHYYTDRYGNDQESISWKPLDSMFTNVIAGDIKSKCSYTLMIVDGEAQVDEKEQLPTDNVKILIHEASPYSDQDWITVLQSMAYRNQSQNDRLFYIYLLWFLGNTSWPENKLFSNLTRYDKQYLPYFLNNLQNLGRCLSVEKQKRLQSIYSKLNFEYQIYAPVFIDVAFKTLFPDKVSNCSYLSLFEKIDKVLNETSNVSIPEDNKNILIKLREWLCGKDVDIETSFIEGYYSLLNLQNQSTIIKRYFHDIRNGKRIFDPAFLESLKNNKYIDWQYYRYSLKSPEDTIVLTNPLLCDLILTLYRSKGESFVTFDGVLDLALKLSNVVRPKINTGMNTFLISCHGGVKVDTEFSGFIDYSIVYDYDVEKFTDDVVLASIRECLDKWARRKPYYTCRYSSDGEPLTTEQLQKCFSPKCFNQRAPECMVVKSYDDIWIVRGADYGWLNILLENQLPEPKNDEERSKTFEVNISQTSITRHRDFILSIIKKLPKKDGKLLLSSRSLQGSNIRFLLGFDEIIKPVSMQFIPLNDSILGIAFDIHGIAARLRSQLPSTQNRGIYNAESVQQQNERIKDAFIKEEQKVVYENLVNELKKRLEGIEFIDGKFEMPYDKKVLDTILKEFYSYSAKSQIADDKHRQFLTSGHIGRYAPFCAPTKADNNNRAIGIPFFWCSGKECFQNALGTATLETCNDWGRYQLYHLVEIIGLPKIIKTEAGNEPDKSIRALIGTVNKAAKKFDRLRCRSCGHLMFPCGESHFNRRNLYHCINPNCPEYNIDVYLNYCFHCKTGLIDSRDSAKCPNGSRICPSCLSCCDDDYYEMLAQKYIVDRKPVPNFIQSKRGHGHNNNGLFFCPACGNALYANEKVEYICSNCQKAITINRQTPEDRPDFNQ